MRPTKNPDSIISAPLNRLFRTEAGVRVLRVLCLTQHPLAPSEVAARTRLDPSGVRRALKDLAGQGIIETVGAGATQPVRLRMAHPFASLLSSLFRAEAARAQGIFRQVRQAAQAVAPAPKAVWMVHPVATREGLDTLQVGVLAPAGQLDAAVGVVRRELRQVERNEDLTVEVRGYTAADLAVLPADQRAALADAVPVLGLPPESFAPSEPAAHPSAPVRSHADLDERALVIGRAVGDRLLRDPTLIERAQEYVREYLKTAAPGERKEMEEWAAILDTMPPARLQKFLVNTGERATRLRQSLPFLGALTPTERTTLLHEASNDQTSAGTRHPRGV
jgi:hypothetical protein